MTETAFTSSLLKVRQFFFFRMVTTQLSKYLLTVLDVVLIISLFELWLKKCLLPSVSWESTCRYRDWSLLKMPVGTIIQSHYVLMPSVCQRPKGKNKHHTKAHNFFFLAYITRSLRWRKQQLTTSGRVPSVRARGHHSGICLSYCTCTYPSVLVIRSSWRTCDIKWCLCLFKETSASNSAVTHTEP